MIDALSLNSAPEPLNFSRFRIRPGELTTLLGSERSLKSLLVQYLSGRNPLKDGALLLDARSIYGWSPAAQDRKLAICEPFMAGSLKVSEVVALGRLPHVGNKLSEDDEVVVAAAMEWMGIAHFRRRVYATLTDSEQLQVRFAKCAAQIWERVEPGSRYLIINEPVLDRDAWTRQKIVGLAAELTREMFGVMMLLKDPLKSASIPLRAVTMKDGELTEGEGRAGHSRQLPWRLVGAVS